MNTYEISHWSVLKYLNLPIKKKKKSQTSNADLIFKRLTSIGQDFFFFLKLKLSISKEMPYKNNSKIT